MDDKWPVILRAGSLEVALAPVTGGSIARFDHVDGERTPILRGADRADASVLDMGCFPLIPYCNRIRGGHFAFRRRTIALKPNLAGDPSPLHGQGWLSPWTVEHAEGTEALLRFDHEPGEWPWHYEARQHFRLDRNGLHITLSCRNLDEQPMPCGLGFHPYFPCTAETELDTRVDDVWTVDERVLPVERLPAEGRYDLQHRAICGQGLDNGFSGWDQEAWIRTPGAPFAIRMSSPDAAFFQVYSPPEGGLFVAEPVTHANAALNAPEDEWSALGMRIVASGETLALNARLDVITV